MKYYNYMVCIYALIRTKEIHLVRLATLFHFYE